MKLKVSNDDLEITSYEIFGYAKDFDYVLKVWNDNMARLSNVWQGEDANEFYLNIGMYLKELKEISNFYITMSEFLKNASVEYKAADLDSKKEFSNKLMEYDANV